MSSIRNEVNRAIDSLGLSPSQCRLLSDEEGNSIFQRALKEFVEGVDRRWWWEAFSKPSFSRTDIQENWRHLTRLVPDSASSVWFIVEDDQLPYYPVYEALPDAIEEIVGDCFFFEYYLIAKDMSWLVCENHHNRLIAVGDAVISRLAEL